MKNPTIAFLIFALAGAACLDTEAPSPDEAFAGDEQLASGPDGSCRLGVPLSCPSGAWRITVPTERGGVASTVTQSLTLPQVASFSQGAVRHRCTATTQDVTIALVADYGAVLPRGVRAQVAPDNKSVYFLGGDVPGANLIPPARDGGKFCSIPCDNSASLPAGCRRGKVINQTGTLRAPDGTTRTVQLEGSVESFNVDALGTMTMTCRWRVPRGAFVTEPSARPNDVIATSGPNFVRGYSLTGSKLANACSGIANTLCLAQYPNDDNQGSEFPACLDATASSCKTVFAGPDPCKPNCGFGTCTRSSDCVSNNCVSGCCIPVIR